MSPTKYVREGFFVDIIKLAEKKRNLYQIVLTKGDVRVSSVWNQYAIEHNWQNIMDELYAKFDDNKDIKHKCCMNCSSTEYLTYHVSRWLCEKCMFWFD